MRPIFISYRRDDTEGQAGRLSTALLQVFGKDTVFMDVTGIAPGVDFRRVIEQKTASCGVLLALIGRNWLTAGPDGRRRLDDVNDFVRLETAAALRRDIPVIPVLVQGAPMPRPDQLPDDLKDLAYRNSVEITHARWDSDMELLVKALRALVDDAGSAAPPPAPPPAPQTMPPPTLRAMPPPQTVRPPRPKWLLPVGGAVLLVALAAGGLAWRGGGAGHDDKPAVVATDTKLPDAADADNTAAADRAALNKVATDQAAAQQAQAQRLAAEKAAAAKAAEDQLAARQAADAQAMADKETADKAAAAKAAADKATADKGAADKAAADKAVADQVAAAAAAAAAAATDAADKAAADEAARARLAQLQAHKDGICTTGFVWRDAQPGDKACVTPQLRSQAAAENRAAGSTRQPGGGPYGTNTCRSGYVWREADAGDVVCVVPASRQQAAADNAAAASRVVPAPRVPLGRVTRAVRP